MLSTNNKQPQMILLNLEASILIEQLTWRAHDHMSIFAGGVRSARVISACVGVGPAMLDHLCLSASAHPTTPMSGTGPWGGLAAL